MVTATQGCISQLCRPVAQTMATQDPAFCSTSLLPTAKSTVNAVYIPLLHGQPRPCLCLSLGSLGFLFARPCVGSPPGQGSTFFPGPPGPRACRVRDLLGTHSHPKPGSWLSVWLLCGDADVESLTVPGSPPDFRLPALPGQAVPLPSGDRTAHAAACVLNTQAADRGSVAETPPERQPVVVLCGTGGPGAYEEGFQKHCFNSTN